ncbi:MAG: fibronectin type III domain-containing protein [Paludibacteraceae bacterium]
MNNTTTTLRSIFFIFFTVFMMNAATGQAPTPYAEWLFDDVTDLTKATIGNDLTLVGTDEVTEGREAGDGASKIGLGSYYKFTHGLTPASGQKNINKYSILYDFKVPEVGKWISFLQTNSSNSNDGDLFVRPYNNSIGLGDVGYSDVVISANRWYQLVVVVDNGSEFSLYLDGEKILTGNPQSIDGRFGLAGDVLLFADNDGDDNPIVVSRVSFYDKALTSGEVSIINGNGSPSPFLTTPYLQNASTTAMTIMCETDISQAVTVLYGTTATSLDNEAISTTEQTIGYNTYVHKTRLSGLTPNTTYYYEVSVDGFTSETLSFKTFTDDDNASFTVGMWSDSHQAVPWKYMADYMVNDLGVDFGFNSGDLSNTGSIRGDLTNVFLPHVCQGVGSRIPFFSALGNHDVGTENVNWKGGDLIRQYLDSPAEVNSDTNAFSGSFLMMHSNVAFISIDWTRMNADLQPGAWLETTLQRSDVQNARFRFIFIHCAPFYERWQVAERTVVKSNIPTLAAKYNVNAVISGHTHVYERGFKDGVTYITQGGAAYYMDVNESVGPNIYDHIVVGTNKPANPPNFDNGLTNHFTSLHVDGNNAVIKLHYFGKTGEYKGIIETIDLRNLNTSSKELNTIGLQIVHHRPTGMVKIACEEPLGAELYDIKGKMVKEIAGFSQELQINTSGMLAGTYILHVNTQSGTTTSKKLLID